MTNLKGDEALMRSRPLVFPYGHRQAKKKLGKYNKCTCNGDWCAQHNDCVWECWNIETDSHMTDEEYMACQAEMRRRSLSAS